MKAVLDVLVSKGDVEWARCVGGFEPLRPPLVAWRYKIVNHAMEIRIESAVHSYVGLIEWVVIRGARNWVIESKAFQQYAKMFRVDVEALQRFGVEFPIESKLALSDAAKLADHLRQCLA